MDTIAQTVDPADLLQTAESEQYLVYLLLFGAVFHIVLAYLCKVSSLVSTFYAISMIPLGFWFLLRDHHPQRLISLTAYIAGAELIWRMTRAGIFWEYGKYSIILLLILAMVRWRSHLQILPFLFILALLPSAFVSIADTPLDEARKQISFNLSGPLALGIAGCFFSASRFTLGQFRRTLVFALFPIAAIAFLSVFKIYNAIDLEFGSHSNMVTSGGYGPNQVSAVLGLGALICFLLILSQERFNSLSWLSAGLLVGFLLQAFLTFSRGGVANFMGAALLAAPFLLGKKKNIFIPVLSLILIIVLFVVIILPRLDRFTDGYLAERFSDTGTTGRWELIQKDLALWQNNFLLGAGVGKSAAGRFAEADSSLVLSHSQSVAAHTEFSRLLAEHGLLGLGAMILMGVMFVRAVLQSSSSLERGMKIALMTWALLGMTHQAMRLMAIAYFFAMPLARIEDKNPCG